MLMNWSIGIFQHGLEKQRIDMLAVAVQWKKQ